MRQRDIKAEVQSAATLHVSAHGMPLVQLKCLVGTSCCITQLISPVLCVNEWYFLPYSRLSPPLTALGYTVLKVRGVCVCRHWLSAKTTQKKSSVVRSIHSLRLLISRNRWEGVGEGQQPSTNVLWVVLCSQSLQLSMGHIFTQTLFSDRIPGEMSRNPRNAHPPCLQIRFAQR